MEDIAIVGRKCFFIAAGESLLREGLLERLMSHGYEAYRIADDSLCPMQKKVQDIIRLFPGCILYFNIDAAVPGIDWKGYLRELCRAYAGDAKLGVVYAARPRVEEGRQIEDYYAKELKLAAGAIALGGEEAEDYEGMLETLSAAGARGRRRIVRVNGDASSSVGFGAQLVRLKDISRAYFCCVCDREQPWKIYEHFHALAIRFCGMEFTADAVLVMSHCKDGEYSYVFMFVQEDGLPELERDQKQVLNRQIYRMLTAGRRDALRKAFAAR